MNAFQYPHSDRDLCNAAGTGVTSPANLFQYPHSDRDLCNTGTLSNTTATSSLSVSSLGSRPLQLCCLFVLGVFHLDFQYPHSDRDLCNASTHFCILPIVVLSVSSLGSRPLQQHRRKTSGTELCNSFSILTRIETSATQALISVQS